MNKSSRPSKTANIAQSKPFIIEGLVSESKRKEFLSSYQLHKKNPIGVIVEKENQKSSIASKLNPQREKNSSRQKARSELLYYDRKKSLVDWWLVDCKDLSIDLGEKNWYDELSDLLPVAVGKHEQKEIACVEVLAGIIYSL